MFAGTVGYNRAYIAVALLTGARTEELRALTWDHVFLKGRPDLDPPQPPHIAVWRSVRRSGGTKTRKSRRTLALPARCLDALGQQFEDQGWDRLAADDAWEEHGLVFSSAVGRPLDAADVRRAFRQALKGIDGINADEWTPRELRCGTASCPCCPTVVYRWKRSPGSSGTPGPP
nr:tyrosine-type recombinase/integrase [Streptomyces sp. SID161]